MSDASQAYEGTVVLLGPQPRDYTHLRDAVDELDVDGPIALITAAWQENESDDGVLREFLDRPVVNLALHERSEKVAVKEHDFVAAWGLRQKHLRRLQEFYRRRLDSIDDAHRAIAVRHVSSEMIEEQLKITVAQLRHLDRVHLERCRRARIEFAEEWPIDSVDSLMEQRREVAEQLDDCAAMIISGGHVVALLNRLRLFDVFSSWGQRPIVAWSAGAMVLTERIVLFHDSPPFGKNLAQLLDVGFGFCPDLVALPDLSERVHLDEKAGIGRFVQRMAPANCLGLDPGSKIVCRGGEMVEATDIARLAESGEVQRGWHP